MEPTLQLTEAVVDRPDNSFLLRALNG